MRKLNEGYLCPECFLNLDCEAALLIHFEKMHGGNQEQTAANHVSEYYKDLITGSQKNINSSKSISIEDMLDLLLDGNLTIDKIPEIELKPKVQVFLKSQLEKELLISRLSVELEAAKQSKVEEASDTQVSKLKAELESYKHAIKNLHDQLDKSEQALQSECNRVLNYESDLANLTKEYEDLKVPPYCYLNFLTIKTEKEEIKSFLTLDEVERSSFVDQVKTTVNNLKSHSLTLSQNVNSSETESADNSDLTEINSLKVQLANLKLEKISLEEKSKNQESLEQLVLDLEKEISFLKDRLEEKMTLENQMKKLKSQDESSQNKIQSLKTDIENSNAIIEKLEVENTDLIMKIEHMKSTEEASRSEVESLKSNIEDSNAKADKLRLENSDLLNQIGALSLEVEAKKQQIENLNHSLADAQSTLNQKDLSIETLNSELKKYASDFEVKSKHCDQLTHQIESLNATITQLTEKLQETETHLKSSLESENVLKTKLAEVESTLMAQCATLETHENTVAETEARLISALAENQALVDQVIERQNKAEQLESVLQMTHQEMDGFQRIVLDLGRQNQALQIQLERLTNRQWVSDDSALACTNCNKEFTISVRKHHCRHCGKVFCNACSSKKTATTASRDPQRVCDTCFTELTGSR
nr:early endosome antigen 1 [Hymenolepis microstoma]